MPKLSTRDCPICGDPLESRSYTPNGRGSPKTAKTFHDCLRQCEKCGIGISNARTNPDPAIIFRDYRKNVPPQVQQGLHEVLDHSLNELNRPNKPTSFASSHSEDAITWITFFHLFNHRRDDLKEFFQKAFGVNTHAVPSILLWGSPLVPTDNKAALLRTELIRVSDAIGEESYKRSEPDVLLDFGDDGLVIVEVKYLSGNSVVKDLDKFNRYTRNTEAFHDTHKAKTSGLYELVRNWRICWDLADGRPFKLVNLGLPKHFEGRVVQRLDSFEASLNKGPRREFLRITWPDVLRALLGSDGSVQVGHQWFFDWVGKRDLLGTGCRT